MKLNKEFFKKHGKQINAGIAGMAVGLALTTLMVRLDFNMKASDIKDETRTVVNDTTYTPEGKMEVKQDTVYQLSEADFDRLKP